MEEKQLYQKTNKLIGEQKDNLTIQKLKQYIDNLPQRIIENGITNINKIVLLAEIDTDAQTLPMLMLKEINEQLLYQYVNKLMGNYEFSNPAYGQHIMTGKIHYKSNDEIQWENIVNEKLQEFIKELYYHIDWQIFMYGKFIPEQIIKKYFNDIDILCMLEYGNPGEALLESISYLFNSLHWRYIFMKPHTAEFLDKFSDKIDFECIAIDNKLPEWFIDKYKDKLNWEDICMFQQLTIGFIENHLSYLTDKCWKYLIKFQKSVLNNINFIIKYADKLKEN